MPRSLRARIYELLEDDERSDPWARALAYLIVALIVLSVGASMLESVPAVMARFGGWLIAIEWLCIALFTLEYAARLWVAVEDRAGRYADPVLGRLRYALTPAAIIDLVAIAPFYLELLGAGSLVFLRVLRLARLLKMTRYSPALATLQIVLANERRSLLSALLIVVVIMVMSAGFMHLAEAEAQPALFGTIPDALWWAAITLTTVGYGDVVPVTGFGRLIAALTALCGIAVLAVPTAILGAGFARELQKQDFVGKASMVARVPAFRHLGPPQLAEVTTLLQPRVLPPRYTILRRGEQPEAMYFIDQGRVLLRDPTRRQVLGPGEFFGEVALLQGRPREATAVTLTQCRLLELSGHDFFRLIGGDDSLREAILNEAQRHAALVAAEGAEPGRHGRSTPDPGEAGEGD
jgi:voltage-gated potassium channel